MKNDLKLTLRVSSEDMVLLRSHTKATRLSQSAYLRMLIRGKVPKAYPPEPFYQTLAVLNQISGSLATIAATAQIQGCSDAPEFRATSSQLFAKILDLESRLTIPEPIESS